MKVAAIQESFLKRINYQEINAFFDDHSSFAKNFKNYEKRPQQIEMAKEVAKTFNHDGFLLAEAGTGVGKSLAYLIPAALWILNNPDERIIFCTHTKTLQNQLFFKDMPVIKKEMEVPVETALLKGRNNYLCYYQWMQIVSGDKEIPKLKDKKIINGIMHWAEETHTGDIDELADFDPRKNQHLWRQLNCDFIHCLNNRCPFFDTCFLYKARRKARQANWVVINHALLLSDMQSDFSVLGPFKSLIIDEAHQLKHVALTHLGFSIHSHRFRRIKQMLSNPDEGYSLPEMLHTLLGNKKNQFPNKSSVLSAIDDLEKTLTELIPLSNDFILQLKAYLDKEVKNKNYKKVRITNSVLFKNLPLNVLGLLILILKDLLRYTERILTMMQTVDDLNEDIVFGLQRLALVQESISELLFQLNALPEMDLLENVVWIEESGFTDNKTVSLQVVPLNYGAILDETLYQKLDRCVFTSATIGVDNQFDYFINQIGLNSYTSDRLSQHSFGSPYHFDEQCLFLIPDFLPNPKSPDFTHAVTEIIIQVLSHHTKGTMILFTSYEMMHTVYKKMDAHFQSDSPNILVQGIHGNRDYLLKELIHHHDSVLMGTNSFWEGIDVAGTALELLIIVKIPFDVPSEPIIQAQIERIESSRGNGFMNFSIPEAIIRFRQGFGRLIRSQNDRGIVLMLDNRVLHTQYGQHFLHSVPVAPTVCPETEFVINSIDNWFQ